MKPIGIFLLASLLLLAGCGSEARSEAEEARPAYQQIGQEEARQLMEQDNGHIVVDVRRIDEYESGHIPGAICIPNESIDSTQPAELPNPDQIILVYCRSGNRSKQAAEKLAALGYTRVCEFGGITDWTGEVAAGQTLVLTVESNPTTGFSWEVSQDRELFDTQSVYVSEPQSAPVSGSGGWQTLILTPKQEGSVQLCFTYTRSWEPSDRDPQFCCSFEIGPDLSVTMTEDGSAQSAEQGYPPVIRIY